ncbi:FAD-dependent oxidoreductase [Cohnella caldifontis]|uniref:FAD-dependent oxidoreductase n=1 Tax=Cohnella caldifontis TaxID=3027471 RepID=UPI0023EE2660|nr:FAD-dependent oxidoreductase [Cohnella sp. YIM B05605]
MKTSAVTKFLALLSLTLLLPVGWSPAAEAEAAAAYVTDHPDIVMIGSEIEGMYLARAAADEGLSVVVLDPRAKPGGQLLEGEMLFLDEPTGDQGQTLLQGRVKELFDGYKSGKIRKLEEFRQYYDTLAQGIPIVSGVTLTGVDVRQQPDASGRFVESVSYRTKDGSEKTIYPGYVVENTDFAALTSRLGLPRIPGMESVVAKPAGPKDYMASTMMMRFKNVDWDAFQKGVMSLSPKEREARYGSETHVNGTFTWGFGKVGANYSSGSDAWFLRGLNTVNQRGGEVMINALLVYGVDPTDEAGVRKALEEGKRQTVKILAYLRKALPGWSKAEINGYPDYLYIRDSDRYETEYVMQGTDLMGGKSFWDNVSIGGYPIDMQGTINSKWGIRLGTPDRYGMPLRSFLAKGYRNVIVAGKNVGASAVAYGSARIQAQTALAGETIGIMLGQIRVRYSLADMTPERMKPLQDYAQKKYGIVLSGGKGKDKTAGLSEDQRRLFNQGKLVLP